MIDENATTDSEIIVECRERLRLAIDAQSANRTLALTAKQFRNGDQWPVDVKRDRDTDARPCLTLNITDSIVRRIINAIRENRPRITTHPVGDGADVQTSELIDGLIRHIENLSQADQAYDAAAEDAVDSGWGYIGVTADYIDHDSFDQELMIERIRNKFTCYPDPSSVTPDGSDYEWFIESEMVHRRDYRQRYGEESGWNFMGAGDDVQDWSKKEELRVAKYWRVVRMNDVLYKMTDGRNMLDSEMPGNEVLEQLGLGIATDSKGKAIKRETVVKKIEWFLLSAAKILDRGVWKGRYIPRVPVYGRELNLNGRVSLKGIVFDLMDPARMYNYAQTTLTEIMALQPKAPWVGPEGFMEGHEAAWRDSNRKPIVALEYKQQYGQSGEPLPAPQRQPGLPLQQGTIEWARAAQSDFMAIAGMPHDPNQDMKGEVVSGIALKRRQGLADISHFDFYDNLCRSLKQVGRILVDLLPVYYDTERIQRIVREDGTPEMVKINQAQQTDGITTIKNNLRVGRYDIVIDTGPSYQTKREESSEAQLELLTTPLGQVVAQTAGDVVIRSMDFPHAEMIADRVATAIPAALKDSQNDLPPKAQTIIAGLQQQLKQAQQQSMALQLELKAKHGLEQIRQQGETERLQLKERAETERTHAELRTKIHDTDTRAVTAHDVAEINAASKLLNTHVEAEHNKQAARDMLEHGAQAEQRSE